MIRVLRQRNFALLWIGQFVSNLGDWVLVAALPFYVYQLTGSALATGLTFVIESVPRLFLGSFAGVLVDRWDRRKVMIAADLARAVVLVLLFDVHSRETIWVVYLAGLLEASLSPFFMPAKSALLPHLVRSDQLISANSLDGLGENLARLIGASLGGALMAVVGLPGVVLVDLGSYLFSGLMVFLIRLPASETSPTAETHASLPRLSARAVWREWAEGLRLVGRERLVLVLFIVLAVGSLGDSILTALIVPFVSKVLGAGSVEFGWLLTSRGLGGLAGGLIIAQWGSRFPATRLIAIGTTLMGALLLVLIHFPSVPLALVLTCVLGLPAMTWSISAQSLLQSSVQDAYRGRVFGALNTTLALVMLVGIGGGSALGDQVGIVPMLDVGCALFLAAGAIAFLRLRARPAFASARVSPVGSEAE